MPATTPSRSPRSIARLQDRDVERIVGRSGLLAARMWRVVRISAESYLAPYEPSLVSAAVNELADLMALGYLTRRRVNGSRRSMGKSLDLNLATPVGRLAREAADKFDLDLGNLRKMFEPISRRGVTRSLKDIRRTMQSAVQQAVIQKMSKQASTAYVLGRVRRMGVSPRTTSYIETLVRTHASISYGMAHYAAHANDPDLWGFELVTVGDERVRDEHARTDGVRRKWDDSWWEEWWPPNGWNCRCQAVAIYDKTTRQTPVPKGLHPDEGFDTNYLYLVT